MNFDFSYTIRKVLEEYVPELTKAHIIRDGLDLDYTEKPYATVEYYQDSPLSLAAGRTSYSEDYHFQIGIFARTINERHLLESKVRTVLRRPDGVPFYIFENESGQFVRTDKRVHLTVNGFTPMTSGDSTEESSYHRGYFDVVIEIIRDTGEREFTQ